MSERSGGTWAKAEVVPGALWERLEARRKWLGISFREVAKIAGVSPSTITRLKSGKKPDADGFMRLVCWLQDDAMFFFRLPHERASRRAQGGR